MPHVNIKHFPPLTKEQEHDLTKSIAKVIMDIIKCDEGAISIAIEPIEKEFWNERVYIPEIVNRKELLSKKPNY
ncbi:MAG: tautomerase family protein [Taibaiella sp.]|jgi:phenylpyruvate tautomerase PptA (4-oxalocrotonate tautomerase family)